jgi:CheY-like chemotaxis protein
MIAPDLPILVAEDNDDEALLLEHALKAVGISNPVMIVSSGEHVIAYLKGQRQFANRAAFPVPGVLITDLNMPGLNGFELLEWLRDHPQFAIIPTLVFSNSSEPRDIRRAYELGANAYLVKPRTMEQLEAMMRMTFDFWNFCARTPAAPGRLREREPLSSLAFAVS